MERIDFHAHCVPPAYREYCLQNEFAGKGHPDGMPAIPEWDALSHVQMMRNLNIRKSILSMSSPGTHLTPANDEEARSLTRRVNEDMSKFCADHPDYFLFFASLPLPDVEGSLLEIDYALDHLGARAWRGRVLSPHRLQSANRERDGGKSDAPIPGVPNPVMEFMFDTTRALTSLLTSGTVKRCPGITFLICHCGATFPPIAARIAEFSSLLVANGNPITEEEVKQLLQTRFYIDLAGVPFPDQIHGMLRLVDTSRLLYGSDYPYTKEPLAASLAKRLDEGLTKEFGSASARQILLENGEVLVSKLQNRST